MQEVGVDPPEPDRPTEDEYDQWLFERVGKHVATEKEEQFYENTAERLRLKFEASPFLKALRDALRLRHQQYYVDTRYRLLAESPDTVEVSVKLYESLVLKSYRRNVLRENWTEPPDGEWIGPENWLTRIHDVLRTSIVVKYLDGVDIVADVIKDVGAQFGYETECSHEAHEEGYYAVHVTVWVPMTFPGETWDLTTVELPVEIQVCTQVQDVIKVLTHHFYEDRRRKLRDPENKWQWNYRSDEFVPNYLGHILHYVEGMIMDVREKSERRREHG